MGFFSFFFGHVAHIKDSDGKTHPLDNIGLTMLIECFEDGEFLYQRITEKLPFNLEQFDLETSQRIIICMFVIGVSLRISSISRCEGISVSECNQVEKSFLISPFSQYAKKSFNMRFYNEYSSLLQLLIPLAKTTSSNRFDVSSDDFYYFVLDYLLRLSFGKSFSSLDIHTRLSFKDHLKESCVSYISVIESKKYIFIQKS